MISRIRKLLIARSVTYGDNGDVEVGDCAEDMLTRKRGFVKSITGDTAVLTLGRDFREIVPLERLRQVRERAKGPDSRAGR